MYVSTHVDIVLLVCHVCTVDTYICGHPCSLSVSSTSSSTHTWHIHPPADGQGWRHIRIKQNGKNSSGQTHYLSLSGMEIYGEIRGYSEGELGMYCTCLCVGNIRMYVYYISYVKCACTYIVWWIV